MCICHNPFVSALQRCRLTNCTRSPRRPDGKISVLEFRSDPPQTMLVACLWSRWTKPGEKDLLSFAIITDDPPPEISEAGHDRFPVPIKEENIDARLNPESRDLAALDAIVDARPDLYYLHKLAS